jgi:hypothetical protein
MNRRPPGELWWDFDHRLVDQHGYRIEVARLHSEPQPLGFKGNGASTGEWVDDDGWRVAKAGLYLTSSVSKDRLVGCICPRDEPLDYAK